VRYWRCLTDGSYRWTEIRTEPLHEPNGTQQWRGLRADIDDPEHRPQQPTKTAFNPPNDDDAVRAAKVVERLVGNAWAFDADGRPTYLTPIGQTLVAATLEEFQAAVDEGHTFFKRTTHPDEYDRIAATWRRSLQTGDPFYIERRIRRATGIHDWSRTAIVPTRDSQGGITGWYGGTIDLDAYRHAEAELRERERELSQLVNIVPILLWRLTPDCKATFFNKRLIDFFGMDVADFEPGRNSLEVAIDTVVHPDDAVGFREEFNRCFASGERFSIKYRVRRSDGVYRWVDARLEPMRGEDGCILQWYGLAVDIDDEVRAQEALRAREGQLQQLIDAVPAVIWCTTPDGIPCYLNKRGRDVTGVTLRDLIAPDGSRFLAQVHPDDRETVDQALARSIKTGTSFVRSYRQRRTDGSHRWVESRAEPLHDDSGNIVQWYGVTVDIHDVVVAQEALRDREEELSQLVNMMPVFIRRMTPQGEPIFFNKRVMDFHGLEDLADLDKPGMSRLAAAIHALIHPDDAASLEEKARRSFASGEPFFMKYRTRRADGVYRWIDTRAEPLRNQSGAIVQWYVVSLDIDDEVHAQASLRDRERELSQLVDMVPAHIRRMTPQGEPIFFNKRLRDFYGLDVTEMDRPGMSRLASVLQTVVHPDDVDSLLETAGGSFASGEPFSMKYRARRADGVYRWVDTRTEPLRDEGGAILQWYAISLDIDDEVRAQQAEEALREMSDKLAKATKSASLAELSASIAHEVNQPLAAIVANSHACQRWLESDPPNLERAQLIVNRIIRDANSAAEVVSRIRALFKQTVESRNTTALTNIIAEARNLIAEEATRRRVRIDEDIESDLPLVAFDRVQVQQILINLIGNGMDAMDASPGDKVLKIRVRRMGDTVQTEISDRGQGIDFPDKIFEPFFTTKEHGMGMGLAICRSIVESHGGRLWAENNKPHGATFIFTLPVEEKAAS
jgi:hypothetical protein